MIPGMDAAAKALDLSVLPPEYRAVFEAQAARMAELEAINRRLEHLVAELNHVVHGRKSEKLEEDDRQLAFEDLEIAVAETREQKQAQAPGEDKPARKSVVWRNRGNLPEGLERIEHVVEPGSLECPCGCGLMYKIGEDRTERLDIVTTLSLSPSLHPINSAPSSQPRSRMGARTMPKQKPTESAKP